MRIFTLLNLLFLFLLPQLCSAQVFGNTTVNNNTFGFSSGYATWWKIVTGPGDSGFITHLGVYKVPGSPTTAGQIALYDDHPTDDRPYNYLGHRGWSTPADGINEKPLYTPVALTPNTVYWIGFKCYQTSWKSGGNSVGKWPYPIKYKAVFYSSSWQNPVTTSGLATQGNANNVAIWAIGNNQTLPVELISFSASMVDEKAVLSWYTANEINNDGWNVQKSENGFTWKTIDWVAGNGDSEEVRSYEYIDNNPSKGISFYRLEQVDLNGKLDYTQVETVRLESNEQSVYPNPVVDQLYHSGLAETSCRVYNQLGQLMFSTEVKEGEPFDFSSFNPGIYAVEFVDGREKKQFKVLKK